MLLYRSAAVFNHKVLHILLIHAEMQTDILDQSYLCYINPHTVFFWHIPDGDLTA